MKNHHPHYKNYQQGALTADLAFVVQLQRDLDSDHAAFKGRVEHIVSGQCKRFSSKEDLCGAIDDIIRLIRR